MTDHVDETLRLWRSTSFEWGQRDCMLSIGDYIASRGGADVTGMFRGSYDSEEGAMRHVERAGGVSALVDLTGLRRCLTAHRGDVCVIDTGEAQVGALCLGSHVAMRLERGTVEVAMRLVTVVNAWKVR